jgi:hypothetical protein
VFIETSESANKSYVFRLTQITITYYEGYLVKPLILWRWRDSGMPIDDREAPSFTDLTTRIVYRVAISVSIAGRKCIPSQMLGGNI